MATTRLRSALLCGGIAAAVVLHGCGDGTDPRDEAVVEIYGAAIQWLVDDASDGGASASSRERVFVEAVGGRAIPLSVQADVVNRLEDEMAVRFIDTRDEAVDTSKAADPVRGRALLVGLGPVPDLARSPVRLYADRYRDLLHVVAYEIVFERTGGRWQVTGEPRPVAVDDQDRLLRG